MLTVKICAYDRTYWIGGVQKVIERSSFPVPEDEKRIPDVACEGWPEGMPDVLHVTSFEGQREPRIGKALILERPDGHPGRASDVWLVPDGATFLLNESGKTVDRL